MQQQPKQQADLFALDQQRVLYAELCNAFYARELQRLSHTLSGIEPQRIGRMLASLPFYVERAAYHLVHGHSPLTLDGQNGSWIAKQGRTAHEGEPQKCQAFFASYARVGLPVPVLVSFAGVSTVMLDTLDQISSNRLHCNQSGWFDLQGHYQDTRAKTGQTLQLLVPSKRAFSSACCGHQWRQNAIMSPRTLSLREMLLTTKINWKNFKQPNLQKDT